MKKLIFSAILLLMAESAFSSTILVPSQQPTIQAGIDAAVEDDTVLVAPGTYTGDGNRDMSFRGKAIVVLSSEGPEVTIVDCQGDSVDYSNYHLAFTFNSGESSSSIITGFTIQNGVTIFGGAISCSTSSPSIDNCIFQNNRAVCSGANCVGDGWSGPAGNGGAIASSQSSLIITNCRFENNSAASSGGALYAWSGSGCDYIPQCPPVYALLTITSCEFVGNNAGTEVEVGGQIYHTGRGGGVYLDVLSPPPWIPEGASKVSDCIFINNHSLGDGGGIYKEWTLLHMLNTVIENNTALYDGGGVHFGPAYDLDSCIFSDNSTGGRGGGAFLRGSGLLDGCNFVNNDAESGGAIGGVEASPKVTNCTMVDNYADSGSGVIWISPFYTPTVDNSIFAFNRGGVAVIGGEMSCTNIYGNEYGDWVGDIADQSDSAGNLSADPLFCDTSTRDFHLKASSPCLPSNNECIELIGAMETCCDSLDVDGDGQITCDDNCPNDYNPNQNDSDGDGYGAVCDCDDMDSLLTRIIWYHDSDGDSYGDHADTLIQCEQPSDYVLDNSDCDDSNELINPTTVWYEDYDGDGYGSTDSVVLTQCERPVDYVLDSTDNCPTTYNPGQEDDNVDGIGDACDSIHTDVAVDNDRSIPKSFHLSSNYPNPFNPVTTIRFSVPLRTHVRLTVYNQLGQKVASLVNGERPAGEYQVVWKGINSHGMQVASGVYLYVMKAGSFTRARTMILLK